MIRTQMGMHNTPENGRNAWKALYYTTPWYLDPVMRDMVFILKEIWTQR
jgi:hypothetical protein